MNTFRFLDFSVYKLAKDFYKEVFFEIKKWNRENWEVGDQIRRALLSVILNIAEGSAKRSDKDFNRYIENALGSINESVAGIDVAFELNLISQVTRDRYFQISKDIAKQLGGLSRKLRNP